jgi:hypothetical protein
VGIEEPLDFRDLAGVEGEPAPVPYFEVLIVTPIGPREEAVLREELHRLRRPTDQFVYEIVVVPSFEDAVIAVLFNCSTTRHGGTPHSATTHPPTSSLSTPRVTLTLPYARWY